MYTHFFYKIRLCVVSSRYGEVNILFKACPIQLVKLIPTMDSRSLYFEWYTLSRVYLLLLLLPLALFLSFYILVLHFMVSFSSFIDFISFQSLFHFRNSIIYIAPFPISGRVVNIFIRLFLKFGKTEIGPFRTVWCELKNSEGWGILFEVENKVGGREIIAAWK